MQASNEIKWSEESEMKLAQPVKAKTEFEFNRNEMILKTTSLSDFHFVKSVYKINKNDKGLFSQLIEYTTDEKKWIKQDSHKDVNFVRAKINDVLWQEKELDQGIAQKILSALN